MTKLTALAVRYVNDRLFRAEIRPATARQERTVLRGLARSYGDRPIDQLARVHIEAWLAGLGPVAPTTRRSHYGIVRRFCRWLVEHRTLRRDPTVGIRTPKVPRLVPRGLSAADLDAVRAVLPDARAHCIVTLLLDLGLRIGEVARIELTDIDWDARTMRIIGKGGHERVLPLVEPTVAAVRRYLADDPPRSSSGPLIRSSIDHRSGLTPVHLSNTVSSWMRASGVKQTPWDGRSAHAYRHTAAGQLADVEPDLRVIQAYLGHVHVSTTSVYLKRTDTGQLRAALERRAAGAG